MHQFPRNASQGYERIVHGSTYVAGDDYDQALIAAAPESGGIRAIVKSLRLSNNGWQAAPWPLDKSLHPTAWVANRAAEVMRELPADKPLFLTASFYAPHPPLFPPADLFRHFLEAELPDPAMGDWVDTDSLRAEGDRVGHRVSLEGETLRRAQAGYLGLIQHLDDTLGPLIESFVARSETAGRPWVIVLTSDHGEMLGDHGYYRKCEPFEGSANIPMVIAGSPELGLEAGQRSSEPVCLEDLMPTLLDLAGIAIPDGIDGLSLVPVLRGERTEVRDWLHLEHARCYSAAQSFHALTDGRFKYVWRPKDGREHLFDLDQDPNEQRDLAAVDVHRADLQRWRAVLVHRLAERPEGFSDGKRLIPGRRHLPLIAPRRRR
jgi:arylsulfatase A-like enzyme